MIQNYSDAELLKLLNKKRSSNRAEKRRHSKHSKRRKNKRRTASLGVGVDRIKRKKRRGHSNPNSGYIEHHLLNHSSSQTDVRRQRQKKQDKLKQLQKYYSLKMGGADHGGHQSHDEYEEKRRSKSKSKKRHKSAGHRGGGRVHKKTMSSSLDGINLSGITDSSQLVSVMHQILGKEKSSAVEEYYKNLYSVGSHHAVPKQHVAKLPQIVTPRNEEYSQLEQMAMANQQNHSSMMMEYERSPDRQSMATSTQNGEHIAIPIPSIAAGSVSAINDSMLKDATNQKVSFSSSAAMPPPAHHVVAAVEPELLHSRFSSLTLNEFEIEDYLRPSDYDDGLGEDTMAHTLLFSNQHNIAIPLYQQHSEAQHDGVELNLPLFVGMAHFDGIAHSKAMEQTAAYVPCRSSMETIEVDPRDWSKILEDKRRSTRTAPGATAVLPLFIPREQRSVFYVDDSDRSEKAEMNLLNHSKLDHQNLSEEAQKSLLTQRRSELDSRQSTGIVAKDVLQRVTAPNVHKINQPPLYQQYEQYEENLNAVQHPQHHKPPPRRPLMASNQTQSIRESEAEMVGSVHSVSAQPQSAAAIKANTANLMMERESEMAQELRQQTMDNIIRETIDNMDSLREQVGGPQCGDDEFISYVTELIVQRISEQMDLSSIVAASKSAKDTNGIPQILQKAVAESAASSESVAKMETTTISTIQNPQSQAPPAKVHQNTMAELHRPRKLASSDLIGNEPLTQGARANQTSIGTALLSVKMSGLKQRLTPSSTATAAIDPYNTNQPHSQIIPTNKFGPNVVTPARPPAPSTLVPDVIHENTAEYHFQTAQQTMNPAQPSTAGPTPVMTTQNSMSQQMQSHPQQQQQAQQQMMFAQPPPMMISPSGFPMQSPFPMQFPMHYPMQSPFPMQYPMQFPYGQPMAPQMAGSAADGKGRRHTMPQMGGHLVRDDISEDTMSVASRRSGNRKSKKKKSRSRSTPSGRDRPASSSKADDEERTAAAVKELFLGAINNRQSAVEQLLAENVDPNTKDEHGNTILHVASQNGNKRLIKVALRWGANINDQNKQGQTALHYLFAYKYENLAAYLISKGADDTLQNEFGYTCYDGLRPAGDE